MSRRSDRSMGLPPSGRTVVLDGVNVFRIEGGRIVERWGRLDELGLPRQLGLYTGRAIPAANSVTRS